MRKKRLVSLVLSVCLSACLLSCNTKSTDVKKEKTTVSTEKDSSSTKAEDSTSKKSEEPTTANSSANARFVKPDYKKGTKTSAEFTTFSNEYFKKSITKDALDTHYFLTDPEKFGITEIPDKFDTIDVSKLEDMSETEGYIKELESFDYDSLTKEQQQTYDVMYEDLSNAIKYQKVALYGYTFGKSNGIQANLPVLMAEFTLNNETDVTTYLSLLGDVKRFYENLLEVENYKISKNLAMSDMLIDGILEQCNTFIENPESHYLIVTFDDRIDKIDSLSAEKKAAYKEQNKKTVNEVVIPAYKMLIDEFTKLKGKGNANGGINNYNFNKEYYEYLMKTKIGTDKTPGELNVLYGENLKKARTAIAALAITNPDILDQLEDPPFTITEPADIIADLKVKIKDKFPEVPEVTTNLHQVHKSLSEFLAPAFYISSPVDNYSVQNIYINNIDKTMTGLYPTITHEGYPGHLYQHLFYSITPHEKIRDIMSFGGYSEGWATYVEMMSYEFAGFDPKLASALQSYTIYQHCLYGQMDIGLNYYGWTKTELSDYLTKTAGITPNDEMLNQLYEAFYEEPANYLQYTVGYFEFIELKNKAKEALGDKFNEKEFHKFILSFGPAQFYIIDYYMDEWIKTQK